jgi:hypothetical protein
MSGPSLIVRKRAATRLLASARLRQALQQPQHRLGLSGPGHEHIVRAHSLGFLGIIICNALSSFLPAHHYFLVDRYKNHFPVSLGLL